MCRLACRLVERVDVEHGGAEAAVKEVDLVAEVLNLWL